MSTIINKEKNWTEESNINRIINEIQGAQKLKSARDIAKMMADKLAKSMNKIKDIPNR
jgi:hypothetical protein